VYRRRNDAAQTTSPTGLFDPVHDTDIKRSLSIGDPDSIAVPPKAGQKLTLTRERTAAEVMVNLGYQPKVIYAASDQKRSTFFGDYQTPTIKVTPASGLQISPPPVYIAVPPPVISPRTAASKDPKYFLNSKATKLPRLVQVESTFAPSLHDELVICEGEKLQLLEEYEDEWCLVQGVGPRAAEKGVIPRFCVVEC
jgi:hypothetical protein